MSGICGVVSLDGAPVAASLIEAMVAAAPHRGEVRLKVPTDGRAAIAHQRRHIDSSIPPGPRRWESSVAVVADARIDNGDELRDELVRGGDLRSDTRDPEALIAAAYEAWGDRCPERIIGDYAFVIWDSRQRRVVAARDPLAMRSLFVRAEPQRLIFATELKQILAVPGTSKEVFAPAILANLLATFGRPEWSFYEGIEQVAPGHALVWDERGRRMRRFWTPQIEGRSAYLRPEDYAEELRRVFVHAVATRMDDSKPTGVFLSGGVDSGSVASAAGWLAAHGAARTPALHAFSWAFEELRQCDERHVSRHIVHRYGFESCEIPADRAGPLACYPEHLPDQDDPFLGTFQPLIEHGLAAAATKGVGVLLGGDRGDLVIGDTGVRYLRMVQRRQFKALADEVLQHRAVLGDPWRTIAHRYFVSAAAERMRRRSAAEWVSWASRKARGVHGSAVRRSYPDWIGPTLLRDARAHEGGVAEVSAPDELGYAGQERYKMIFTPLHIRSMAWSERTYARYGIGFADPFSDQRLVEFVLSIPQAVINRPGDQSKPLMRTAMAGLMPEAARRTADKIVPTPLYERGLRESAPVVRDVLTAPQLEARGWVDARALREHYEEWLRGGRLRAEFWWTLQVELWLRTHWS